MTKVVLQRFGRIPKKIEREIISIIDECYIRLKPHEVELVDVLLFEDSSKAGTFYMQERSSIGIVTDNLNAQFFAMHDAWRGTSRIGVVLDRMKKLPKLIQTGALRHEVGHSVLHSSLEHYTFSFNKALVTASKQFKLSKGYLINLIYLISIAVKDYEVSRLLLKKGFVEDQLAYLKYILKTSEDDLVAWKIAKDYPSMMVLALAGRLKDIASFTALASKLNETEIINSLRKELSYLPSSILDDILKIVKRFPEKMSEDSSKNVDLMMKIFVEDLLKPIYEGKYKK
ncbi:hypothetical protein [[Eubacterium] cellulosolvens]